MTIKNYEGKAKSLRMIMSSAPFLHGFQDVINGRWTDVREELAQWRYERGRMFAVWLRSKGQQIDRLKLKQGRWIRQEFINAYVMAKKEGSII
jgi:hypothetical protein